MNRRMMMLTAAGIGAGAGISGGGAAAATAAGDRIVRARDGAALYVKDWGNGPPVVFVHSWALNADMWEYQMTPMAEHGRRVVAFDRRGHGRSQETAGGYDIDTLADDLAAVIETLDLKGVTLVGHSMGGAEAVRYLSRHGTGRVARLALVSPTTPCLRQSPDNPNGVLQAAFDQARTVWRRDRAKWLADNGRPFVMPDTSQAMMDWLMGLMMQASLKVWLDCNDTITAADFRPELAALKLPVLVIHGDADASAPLPLTGRPTAALVPGAKLIVYEGAPHGLFVTHAERLNADLAAFMAA